MIVSFAMIRFRGLKVIIFTDILKIGSAKGCHIDATSCHRYISLGIGYNSHDIFVPGQSKNRKSCNRKTI